MNTNMKLNDLKVGMAVRMRSDYLDTLSMVMPDPNNKSGLCTVDEEGSWMSLDDYNEDFTHNRDTAYDITEVYDISEYPCFRLSLDASHHDLLWIVPKEMTHEEIEKELGYPIRIVSKKSEPKSVHKFEVGDRVRVRNLEQNTVVKNPETGTEWAYVMKEFAGMEATITEASDYSYKLNVDHGKFYYPPMFLEPVTDDKEEEE